MLVALVFSMAPLAVLLVAGVRAASRAPRRVWNRAAALAVVSTIVWLVNVGLFQHETPCDGRLTGCPTVYGYDAPLPDDHAAGVLLLFGGFLLPAAWAGWRRLAPPLTTGAALALGPTTLAWWTAPRGDNDGLWALIFWFLPVLGGLAAVVVAVLERVRLARHRSVSSERVLTVATLADRLAALVIDVAIVGGLLVVPLTALSHAAFEVLAGVLGLAAATAYLTISVAWRGRTIGHALIGLMVLDARTGRRVSANRATLRSLVIVLELAALSTVVLAVAAAIELISLSSSGRTVTDRLLGISVLSECREAEGRPAAVRDAR